ncbi:hypothetical protein SOM61_26400, partial [Massilia sp. CFBP9012]|uniref:hypothetical protein n=1 Tax=Massilia sp. CFBP9012 TaxID=3096531 RepID=UPI002A69E673
AHTYRLLIFKELYSVLLHLLFASNRFVRQQQRRESMKRFLDLVNPLFPSAFRCLEGCVCVGRTRL